MTKDGDDCSNSSAVLCDSASSAFQKAVQRTALHDADASIARALAKRLAGQFRFSETAVSVSLASPKSMRVFSRK